MFALKLKYFKPVNKNSKVAAANFFKLNQALHANRALQVLLPHASATLLASISSKGVQVGC